MSKTQTGMVAAAISAGASFSGAAFTVVTDNYTSVTENLGHGPVVTNYGQAFAYCGSPLGQRAVAASSTVAATCQSVGNVNAWCTVALVVFILGLILALTAGVLLLVHERVNR